MRRLWQAVMLIGPLALSAFAQANAETYPSRQITIVIGYTPGAVSDLTARTIAEGMRQEWGQPVVVDNRSGSGGNIGAAYVARAVPDGYTLMIGTDAQMASNVHLYKQIGFDPVKDFVPVAYAGGNIICLAVNAELPIKTVADLIAYAKANPRKLSYGSSGVGSPHHLAGELLHQKAGIDIVHVPYKGGGAAVNDVLGGHISMAFLSLSAAAPQVASGRLRIIAMVEKTRYAAMPDIPTIGETVPGFEMSSWIGVFAPAGTPRDIVTKLNGSVARILNVPDIKERLATLGLVAVGGKPDELADIVKDGIKIRGELIRSAGIQPE